MRTIAKACGAWIVWGLLAAAAPAQGISWQSDLETAKHVAASSNRLVLMHFSASWCHWCKPLEKNVFGRPEVIQALEANYVAVRMDYDEHRQIARQYNVKGVPWDVVITPDGYWVADFNSPQTAEQYAARVTKVAAVEAAKMNALYANQPPNNQPAGPMPAAAPMPAAPQHPTDDRYADYYARQQPQTPRVDPTYPPYADQVTPPASPGPQAAYGGAVPSTPGIGPAPDQLVQAPGFNAPLGMPGPASTSLLQAPTIPASPPATAQPTFAMEGHCPVHLLEKKAWVPGDRRWGAKHQGKTYLFTSEECQKKFMADPDRYAPALSGHDPVALVDRGVTVEGRREHGCYFGAEPNLRIVLFADEASFLAFQSNPQRYAGQIFAAQ